MATTAARRALRSGGKQGSDIVVTAVPDSEVGSRFPNGSFHIAPAPGTQFDRSVETSCSSSTGGRVSSRIYVSSPRRRASWSSASGDSCYAESLPAPILAGQGERIIPTIVRDGCGRRARCRSRSPVSRTSSRGSHTMRSSITCRREASSNTPAAAGARATSARDRSSCCSPWVACNRYATCCCG